MKEKSKTSKNMKYKTYRRGCNSIFALIKNNLKKRKREKRRVEEFLLTIVEMKVEEDRIFLSIYLIIFFFSKYVCNRGK